VGRLLANGAAAPCARSQCPTRGEGAGALSVAIEAATERDLGTMLPPLRATTGWAAFEPLRSDVLRTDAARARVDDAYKLCAMTQDRLGTDPWADVRRAVLGMGLWPTEGER
jgi:hypothetical protein